MHFANAGAVEPRLKYLAKLYAGTAGGGDRPH